MKIVKVGFLLLLLTSLVLSACGSQAEPTEAPAAQPTEAPVAEPTEAPAVEEASVLVIGVSHDLTSLDPARAMEPSAAYVHKATYDTLITLGDEDITEFVPELAESWEVTENATVFTYHLRPGVKFHTGNEVSAKDVKWSFERLNNIKGEPSWLMENVESVETPDDMTVVITPINPQPDFLAATSSSPFSVLDSEAVKAQGGDAGPNAETEDTAEEWLNQNSAGTAPFVLKSWTLDNEIVLEKFDDAWRGPAKLDKVIYKDMPSTANAKLALEAGDINLAALSSEQATDLESDPDINIVEGHGLETFFLLGNRNPDLTDGIMSNPLVMEAIRYAIDYDGMRVLAGFASSNPPSPIPFGIFGAWDESHAMKRDLDKAKALLAEAGYPDGFEIDMDYPTELSTSGVDFDIMAEKVQADLAELGIDITLKPTEELALLSAYRAGELGFTFWPWLPGAPDINDYIHLLPGGILGDRSQWTEERATQEILDLRDIAAVETDPEKRLEVWDKIQTYLLTDSPFVNLVQAGIQVGVRDNIKGYVYNQMWFVDPYLITKE